MAEPKTKKEALEATLILALEKLGAEFKAECEKRVEEQAENMDETNSCQDQG
ncbi:MAG: hypothetical protein QGG02_03410 [Gammaproteobacteria bacterium]|jgi:hypothetical protein|nr:hypothetical protein [Gammaproteobacteria bacterium]MDP6733935.1 hypothetical protein [Gammaproteobacteria bacterium]|tara:strand:+ start:506 stop:661 length:156 start_codon:yes stop_codon:yes gene_type:complete